MLETRELLDRFELLYPNKTELSDLRRAYNDEDLSSIFRLASNFSTNLDVEDLRKAVLEHNLHSIFRLASNFSTNLDVEDLRKAVLEHNLHSIFRLLDLDDVRKLVLDDNTWSLWKLLDEYTDTHFVAAFKNFFVNNTEIWNDCFSRGQLESKLWLVNELEKLDVDLGTVFLCAGWYATLATMLFESDIKVNKIRSFDIDPNVWKVAEVFNKPWVTNNWTFKASTKDILDINFKNDNYFTERSNGTTCELNDTPDTIINTSCEHIENFAEWYDKIPDSKLVVLQSNNFYEVEEHVNCVGSVEEFAANAPMQNIFIVAN